MSPFEFALGLLVIALALFALAVSILQYSFRFNTNEQPIANFFCEFISRSLIVLAAATAAVFVFFVAFVIMLPYLPKAF